MRKFIKTAGLVGLALLQADAAAADVISDCGQSRNLTVRVAACSEIVAGAGYSSRQKGVAYRHRGLARADAGAFDQAISDLGEALRLDPNDAVAYDTRAHARLAKGATDQAIADFSSAMRLQPKNVSFIIARGHAFLVKGNVDAAIIDFSEAIQINPKSASAYNNKGLAWRKKGNLDQAISDFTTAISLNPIYAIAYLNRGYAHESKGARSDAVADFSRALQLDRTLVGASAGLKRLKVSADEASQSEKAVREGKVLAEGNCSRCHAVGASGQSPHPKAPEFRLMQQRHPILALREPLTRGIAAPHDEMPNFALGEAEVDKLIAYINTLQSAPRGWSTKVGPAKK